jgi:hypothetical protein
MKKILLIWLIVSAFVPSDAQTEKRNNIYLNAAFEKDFLKTLTGGVSIEERYCGDPEKQEFLIKPYLEFSPVKYFSFGTEYRWDLSDGKTIGRLGLAMKLKYDLKNFRPEFRLKYCNYNGDYVVSGEEKTKQYLRSRFQLGYRIKTWKLTPYVSYEWFYNFPRKLVDIDRWTFGVRKKFAKRHTLAFEYRFYERFNRVNDKGTKLKNDINENIFLLSYKYSLPYKKKSE